MEAALEAKKHDIKQMKIALGAKEERLDEAQRTIEQLQAEVKVRLPAGVTWLVYL